MKKKNDNKVDEVDTDSDDPREAKDDSTKDTEYTYLELQTLTHEYHDFLDKFHDKLKQLSFHRAANQIQQDARRYILDHEKKNMPEAMNVIATDYIQNMIVCHPTMTSDQYQDRPQMSYLQINHWFPNPQFDPQQPATKQNLSLDTTSYQMISSDQKHDSSSSVACLSQFFDSKCDKFSAEKGFKRLDINSDTSPKEFGNSRMMKFMVDLSVSLGIVVYWVFACEYHGKFTYDSEGAVVKGKYYRGIRADKLKFSLIRKSKKKQSSDYHAERTVEFLNASYQQSTTDTVKREAIVVPMKSIKHTNSNVQSLNRFKKHYAFRTTDNPNQIQCRTFMCYCDFCLQDANESDDDIDDDITKCAMYDICGPWKTLNFRYKN